VGSFIAGIAGIAGIVPIVCGIFVGGASRRMGGAPKGLLAAPSGETIVARSIALCEAAKLEVILVGEATAYVTATRAAATTAIADEPPGIGPLGGIVALLAHASHLGARHAIALACDMPYVTLELLERLSRDESDAAVVAPRRHDGAHGWEPLCARYHVARVLPIARARALRGAHALQALLDDAGARELPLATSERAWLRDWDTPSDRRSR
jgi:molybdopterin-guanine dinucleotide biosynthesis protein A